MIPILSLVGLYCIAGLLFGLVGSQAVRAWREIEMKRLEGIKMDEMEAFKKEIQALLDAKLSDIDEFKSKVNKLHAAKVFGK